MIASQFWAARGAMPTLTAIGLLAITPNDGADNVTDAGSVNHIALGLWVNVGGTVKVTCADGSVDTLTCADKTLIPLPVKRVWSTGTTATGIHAFI